MYIQLTEKCNMTCVHCCFAATRHGETMSRDVYIRALDRQRKYREFDQGYGGVRSVSWINPVGRAVEHKNEFDQLHAEATCCCETVLVDPLGNVFSCGCKTHLLGNVFEHDLADYLRGLEWDELHTGGGLEAREHARLYPQTQQAA